jgi:hypothetical protein
MGLGARLLQAAPDVDAAEGHQVYADPAGHPFCISRGHPSREQLARFVAARLGQRGREVSKGPVPITNGSPTHRARIDALSDRRVDRPIRGNRSRVAPA